MTFTVTPQPNNDPPRVRIDLDTDDPTTPFTELTIYRDGKKIREQPYIGGASTVAFDYEAPFGVTVTYSATGSVADFAPTYSTSWTNLTGWTTVSGTPGVASGKLYSTDGTYAQVTRSVGSLTRGRVTIAAGMISSSAVTIPTAATVFGIEIGTTAGGSLDSYVSYAGATKLFSRGTGTIICTFSELGATITTSTGTWWCARGTSFEHAGALLVATALDASGRVPGLVVENQSGSTPFSASASTTLDVDAAWLIHPSQPSLSIPIDFGIGGDRSLRFIEASSGDSRMSNAQSAIHRPIGRRRAVVITSGPRQADEWTLVIGAPTVAAKNAVRAIVDDQTPLLLRFPAGKSQDLPDDWYSVGDVDISRIAPHAIIPLTLITLPLIPVDEPIVRQGALWTWGDVVIKYPTWADVIADNDTWIDVLAGPS